MGVVPNSPPGRVPPEIEQVVQLLLEWAESGEHLPDAGPAAFALAEQHGLADAFQFAEQREHAGEQVDADLVAGDVVDRAEGDDVRVLGLTEPGFKEQAALHT